MTRQETETYYDAMGCKNRTVFIDSLFEKDEIKSNIEDTVAMNGNETIYIETFHMNENIVSYSLILSPETDKYSLWEKHQLKLENKTIDEIVDCIYTNLPANEKSPYRMYVDSWVSNRVINIKSFDDTDFSADIDIKNDIYDYMDKHVLGIYNLPDGNIECHNISKNDISLLTNACEQIHDKNIRLFTKTALLISQSYINKKPYNDNNGGENLYMHILHADKILGILTGTHYARIKFQQKEIDMMRSAVLLSDILKFGWDDEENDDIEDTIVKHPSVTADIIRSITGIIDANELNFIANCIESHSYEKELCGHVPPVMPDTEYKYTVQLAHMIADATSKG